MSSFGQLLNAHCTPQYVAILPVSHMVKGEFPEALQKGKICLLVHNDVAADYPDNKKGQLIQTAFNIASLVIIFDLNRRTTTWVRVNCPNKTMSCIGKYRRNLINMQETLMYFYFEKGVFLVELCTIETSSYFEMSAHSVFWLYNSIFFVQSVGRVGFHYTMIGTAHSETPRERFDGFYVSKPKILEPRRPMATTEIRLEDVKLDATKNIRSNNFTTSTFFHEIVSVEIFPSIDC